MNGKDAIEQSLVAGSHACRVSSGGMVALTFDTANLAV
jgi:hypothetical protein